MKKTNILLIALLALLAAGCHTAKKATKSDTVPVVETPVPAPKRTYTVMNFTGEVQGINVNGQLRIAEDSVMWMSVTKVIEMGRALCTPDSLWLRSPLMGRDDAMDYPTLQRLTGVKVTFGELQETALADDAEERIARMAAQLGFTARIRITQRREVEQLTFPYTKPVRQ